MSKIDKESDVYYSVGYTLLGDGRGNYKMTSYESQKMKWNGKEFVAEGKPEEFGDKSTIEIGIVRDKTRKKNEY